MIKYCDFVPPQDPGNTELAVPLLVKAPAPIATVPLALAILAAAKLISAPLQTVAGVAVTEEMIGNAFTVTATVLVNGQVPLEAKV